MVDAAGGTLSAGPGGSGWTVRAQLPSAASPAVRRWPRWRGPTGLDWALVVLAIALSLGASLLSADVPDSFRGFLPAVPTVLLSGLHAVPLGWRSRMPGRGMAAVLLALMLWLACDLAGWMQPPVSDIFRSTAGEPWSRLTPAQQARLEKLNSTPQMLAASLLLDVNPGAAHALVGDREVDHWMHEVALTGKDSASCQGAPPAAAHHNPQGFYSNQILREDFERITDPRPNLRAAHVPSLVLRGECDFIKPSVTDEYRRTLPDSQLVTVKGAGHAISRGRPRLYTALLRAFLLGRPLPATTA